MHHLYPYKTSSTLPIWSRGRDVVTKSPQGGYININLCISLCSNTLCLHWVAQGSEYDPESLYQVTQECIVMFKCVYFALDLV